MQQRAEVTPKPERIKAAAEFLESGKTMVAWSKERRINRYTLHNWVDEYRQETKATEHSCGWLEVSVNATRAPVDEKKEVTVEQLSALYSPIRIAIGNTQIEVTTSFDEKALAAVIKAVKC
jgi:transposase-like protein